METEKLKEGKIRNTRQRFILFLVDFFALLTADLHSTVLIKLSVC